MGLLKLYVIEFDILSDYHSADSPNLTIKYLNL